MDIYFLHTLKYSSHKGAKSPFKNNYSVNWIELLPLKNKPLIGPLKFCSDPIACNKQNVESPFENLHISNLLVPFLEVLANAKTYESEDKRNFFREKTL